jgi:P-type Cu+ transporter
MVKDPICGMEVDDATAKFSVEKDTSTYYFCSKHCEEVFLSDLKKDKNEVPINNESLVKHDSHDTHSKQATSSLTEKVSWPIQGMHCASCAITIENALKKTPGVEKVTVNSATEKAVIEFNPNTTNENTLRHIIEKQGYSVLLAVNDSEKDARENEMQSYKTKTFFAFVLSVPLMYVMFAPVLFLSIPGFIENNLALFQLALATPILYIGREFFTRGIRVLVFNFNPTMDSLVAIGVGSAYLWSLAGVVFILSGDPYLPCMIYILKLQHF